MNRKLVAVIALLIVIIVVVAVVAVLLIPPQARPSVIVIGTTEREETLDPADAYNYMSVNILQNTMATLLTYSEAGDGTLAPMLLTVVPSLANGGISGDGRTYTLRLRTGVTFQDGTAIDATVVKFGIDRAVRALFDPVASETRLSVPSFLLEPIRGAGAYFTTYTNFVNDPANWTQAQVDAAWNNYSQPGAMQGVEVVDSTTVRIHMGRVWSPMVQLLAFTSLAPVNPTVFTQTSFRPQATQISASGPYLVDVFVPGERAELVRNARYFGAAAPMERVVIRFFADAPALALAMQSGGVDIAYRNLNPEDFEAFKTNPNVRAEQGQSPVIRYLVFNNNSAPFNNKLVRQALAYAVNRQPIVQTVFLNSTQSLYSLIPEGMFGHDPVFQTRYARNVANARALLTQAGYSETNRLSFTLWYTPSRYGSTEADVATLLKQAWEETNMVTVSLNNQEWTTYRQSFRTGTFQVFLLGWFPDYLDPDNYVFPFLHAASGGTASFGSWYTNATLDQLIELQATQTDPAQRAATLAAIQDALADDVPYIPLWQQTQQVVYRPNVSGVILDQSQFFRYFTLRVA